MTVPHHPDSPLPSTCWDPLRPILKRFEKAWQQGQPPVIEQFLPPGPTERSQLLPVLVHVDLEYRCKAGEPIRVEAYLKRFPELRQDQEVILSLIRQERELRRGREPNLADAEYARRFPDLAATLQAAPPSSVWTDVVIPTLRGTPAQQAVSQPSSGLPRIAGYEVRDELGRGGMGTVLRAYDPSIRREVAIKCLLDPRNPQLRLRFIEEAQITGQLAHPGIVPVHQLGTDGAQRPFFCMKKVEGRSLAEVLEELRRNPKSARQWSLSRLLTILVSICNAMAYAHSRGIIHRDLKPANIMIGDFGEVYVMDWGLAKVLRDGDEAAEPLASPRSGPVETVRQSPADQTQPGRVLGTPVYMSPEQAEGKIDEIDQRSDVYALGAILYEMLTLQAPVEKEGGCGPVLRRVIQGEIVPPRQRVRGSGGGRSIPNELSAIAMKALATRPARRYQTVEALRGDLERYQEGRSVSARGDAFHVAAWKLFKRNKGISVGFGLALLILAGSLWFVFQAWRETDQAYGAYRREQERRREQMKQSVPAFVRAGRLLVNEGRFPEALAQANSALEFDEHDPDARLLRAQLLLADQKYAEARADLDEYLKHRPKDQGAVALAILCREIRPDHSGKLQALASMLNHQKAFTLGNRVAEQAARLLQSREEKLAVYRKQIEAAWRGEGDRLTFDEVGVLILNFEASPFKDLTPLQGLPLNSLNLRQCAQLRDLASLRGMPLTSLILDRCAQIRDLTPLQGMKLTALDLGSCGQITDLSPLQGMPLTSLNLDKCAQVTDLSPLQGMPLKTLVLLDCSQITDLAPLKGMQLTSIDLAECGQIADLAPLQGMPLTSLELRNCGKVTDLAPLKGLQLTSLRLQTLTQLPDLGGLQGMRLTKLYLRDLHRVEELEPLRGMPLTELVIERCDKVWNLGPLHGMPLTQLAFYGCPQIADLKPLQGMPLTTLVLTGCPVKDLTPLQGAKLASLDLRDCGAITDLTPLRGAKLARLDLKGCGAITDLTPLRGMPLTALSLNGCGQITDLAPLRGMKLTGLEFHGCPLVKDLTPLQGMPLAGLGFEHCSQITDLSPLRGMKLTHLAILGTGVTDLTSLEGMKLERIYLTPKNITRGMDVLRGMRSLQHIHVGGAEIGRDDFWKRYDAGEFRK